MDRKAAFAALLPGLMLHACGRAAEPPEPGATDTAAATSPAVAEPAPAGVPPGPSRSAPSPGYSGVTGIDGGYPGLTPPPLTPEAEKGIKGARNVLLAFARAVELREFDQAWAMLSPGDRQKWSRAEFTRMLTDLGKIVVAIPSGTVEGAAGSLYYTGPLTITAVDDAGRPVRIEGEAVLRRVNDVDGATPAQLRWHFDKLTLDRTQ